MIKLTSVYRLKAMKFIMELRQHPKLRIAEGAADIGDKVSSISEERGGIAKFHKRSQLTKGSP